MSRYGYPSFKYNVEAAIQDAAKEFNLKAPELISELMEVVSYLVRHEYYIVMGDEALKEEALKKAKQQLIGKLGSV